MISDQEKSIGRRLRQFRETLRITRTQFAISIGISSESMASYEAGRARLPFGVFLDMVGKYQLNPFWLAGNDAMPMRVENLLENPKFIDMCKPFSRAQPFSAFLGILAGDKRKELEESQIENEEVREFFNKCRAAIFSIRNSDKPSHIKMQEANLISDKIRKALQALYSERDRRQAFQMDQTEKNLTVPKNDQNKDLTDTSNSGSVGFVQLPGLLERLNRLCSESGKMTELATFLKAPLPSVSRWLAGKREPGAEVTLKLLQWAQDQEKRKLPIQKAEKNENKT